MHGKPIRGLSAIIDAYDVILSDVWGVVHNGVSAWPSATLALSEARKAGKRVILVSNAPRPSPPVRAQLARLGASEDAYDDLVTSGDVTRSTLMTTYAGLPVTHIGPDKDKPLVEGLPVTFTDDASAQVCLCSGLLDDLNETPEDYRTRLLPLAARGVPMICANPDRVVEMGDRLLYCAGALADLYEELGGETVILGKPYAPIYEASLEAAGKPDKARVLALGDSLRTDVRGAADLGVDCLFLTGGIHAKEFGPATTPNPARVAAFLDAASDPVIGWMARLSW